MRIGVLTLNSALAGFLSLWYLDHKVFNLHQVVLTQRALGLVGLDVAAVGQDGTHQGDLH